MNKERMRSVSGGKPEPTNRHNLETEIYECGDEKEIDKKSY